MSNVLSSLQNLTKSMADFSWALSIFGASQASSVALELTSGGGDQAAQRFEHAASALKDELAGRTRQAQQAGAATLAAASVASGAGSARGAEAHPDRSGRGSAAIAQGGPDLVPDGPIPPGRTDPPPTETPGRGSEAFPSEAPQAFFPADARNAFAEEVFSVYNVGTGTVDAQGTLINLNVDMFDFEGRWCGIQTGTQADYGPPETVVPLAIAVPPPPALPIDQPPVPNPTRISYTQGVWTFNDGSAIFAQGPSWTHMVPLQDEAFMFMVTTAHVITRGTGLFEGVQGIKQGTGSTYVAPGLVQEGKFPAPGVQFTAKVIDTFRYVRKGFLDIPALGGKAARVRE